MNQNIKALFARGIIAVKALEAARSGVEANVKILVENPNTKRAVLGYVGSITPRGIAAFVTIAEGMTAVYEEISTKVLVLNQAMPGIAEALEAASEAEGCIPAAELMEVSEELHAEARKEAKSKAKKVTLTDSKVASMKLEKQALFDTLAQAGISVEKSS